MKSNIRLAFARLAVQDVREILQYTNEQWGRRQRNAYFGELKRAARQLQAFPEMGRLTDEGVRELVVQRHIVLFRHPDDVVTIRRVLTPRRLRQ